MTDRGMPEEAAAARRLGEALRLLQQGSGRPLRSLERQVLISDSSLSRYFRGSTVPPWATVRDLCRALDADPADYRALWEATRPADRGPYTPDLPKKDAPETTGSETISPETTGGPENDRPSFRRTWAAVTARLARPWAHVTLGVVTGILLGAALTPLLGPPPAASGPPATLSTHKEGHGSTAGTADSVRIFVSRATGACLDDSLDFGLRSYACNGMSYQRWTVHPLPDGTRQLRNHATGRCLHGAGGSGLRTEPCDTSAPQRWLLTTWHDESVEVRSKSTTACLEDGDIAGLRFLPCDRTERQKWG